jgi:hypothetical protein
MQIHLSSQLENHLRSLLILLSSLVLGLNSCASNRQPQGTRSPTQNSAESGLNVGNREPQETTRRLEQAITQYLPQEIGLPIQSVTCPAQTILIPGNVFDCDVKITEGTFPVKVTVKNAEGQVTLKTRQILLLPAAEAKLQQSIKQREGLEMKANCGGKVKIVKKVGETFQCKLTGSSGKTGSATMTVTSREGKVDAKWKIPETAKQG